MAWDTEARENEPGRTELADLWAGQTLRLTEWRVNCANATGTSIYYTWFMILLINFNDVTPFAHTVTGTARSTTKSGQPEACLHATAKSTVPATAIDDQPATANERDTDSFKKR